MKKRKVFQHNQFKCVVAFWKGKYQGVARLSNEVVFKVIGIDLEDVEIKLKDQIEKNGQEIVYDHLKKVHQELLKSNNVENYQDIEITLSKKNHRTAHCFRCRGQLDNHYNHECNACGWILCVCGACGCSYMKF